MANGSVNLNLPEGFVLEKSQQVQEMNVPAGFTLETPQQTQSMNMPEGFVLEEKQGFVSGLTERPEKFLPFYGSLIQGERTMSTISAAKRLEADDYSRLTPEKVGWGMIESPQKHEVARQWGAWTISPYLAGEAYEKMQWTPERQREHDIDLVSDWLAEASKKYTTGGRIGQIVGEMPTFMLEFIATGGLAKAPEAATKQIIERAVGKGAKREILAKMGAWAAGSTVQATLGMGHRTFQTFAARRLPKDIYADEAGNLGFEWSEESPYMSFAKAYGDTVIEVASEHAGRGISKVGGWALNKLPFGKQFVGKLHKAYQKLHPNVSFGNFINKIATKAGYHGIVEEIGEEYLGDAMRAIANVEDFGAGPDAGIGERLVAALNQDIRNTPAMFAAFAVPGVGRMAAGIVAAPPSMERLEKSARAIQANEKLTDFQKAEALEEIKRLLPIEEQIAKPDKAELINVYKTESGSRTGITEQEVQYNKETGEYRDVQTGERVILDKEASQGARQKAPGIVEQEQKPGSLFEISESAKRRIATARKFESTLIELETKRPELRKQTEAAREKELQKFNEIYETLKEDDPIIASRIARSMVKGFLRQEVPELTEQISREEIVDLKQAVREASISTGQKMNLVHFFEDILAGRQPFRSHIKSFDKFFGTQILKKTPKPKAKGIRRVVDWITEPFNLVKAVVCSMDFSAGGIQALMVAPSHPVIWGKAVTKGYRAFFSQDYLDLMELEMKTDPRYHLIEEHGRGLITEIGSKTRGEEYFVSELAHRIPLIGVGVKASDRAFVATLNNIRSNLFYQWMEMNPGASNVQIKEMLDHIGNLTGRGRGKAGGKFEKFTPELGAVLWAPRLYLGTIKSMTDVVTKSHIRKQAAGDLVRATAFLMGILGLASLLPDTEVELDPRSTDFGKIKRGNTRLAFFGRHTQMIRFVVQVAMGQKKSTGTGRIHDRPRLEMAARYLRSKLNPMAGVGWDVATGKTFLGERMEYRDPEFIAKYFAEHTVPMFLQDVADAVRYQGLGTALWTSPLGLHGIGMQTYEVRRGAESQQLKDHYAHSYFGVDWDQLGPDAQEALRDSQPLIEVYEDRARAEREQYVYEDWTQAEQRLAGQRVVKKLKKSIRSELTRLEMPFGGLSRRLSSDWMLNEKRYKEYQDKTAKLINEVVPGFIESPMWKNLDPMAQRDMLEQLLDDCKKAVRDQIVGKARFEDVQRTMEMQKARVG